MDNILDNNSNKLLFPIIKVTIIHFISLQRTRDKIHTLILKYPSVDCRFLIKINLVTKIFHSCAFFQARVQSMSTLYGYKINRSSKIFLRLRSGPGYLLLQHAITHKSTKMSSKWNSQFYSHKAPFPHL